MWVRREEKEALGERGIILIWFQKNMDHISHFLCMYVEHLKFRFNLYLFVLVTYYSFITAVLIMAAIMLVRFNLRILCSSVKILEYLLLWLTFVFHGRFFYIHLWRPWDCDDENQDWLSTHLEARLQL
jgi:hypothetical protein